MKKSLSRLYIPALALVFSACQFRTETKVVPMTNPTSPVPVNPELIDFQKHTLGTPLSMNLADDACATRPEAQSLTSEAVEDVFYNHEDNDEQTIAITTRVINSQPYERELTNKTDLRYTVQSEKKPLAVCSPKPSPKTVEDAGLRSKKAVDDSLIFYRKIMDSHPQLQLPELPALGIGLFPLYKKDVKRVEQLIKMDGTKTSKSTQTLSIQTDNAFYSPFYDSTLSNSEYAIAIIPQSLEAKQQGLYNGKGLWEFPVVFHHEYGHHVFQMLFGSSTLLSFRQYLDYWQSHRSLHAIHGALDLDQHSKDPENQNQRQAFLDSPGSIFGALNEGFADLFAYYSMNEAPGLFAIDCFKQTREIPSPLMYGGYPKVWDDVLWKETFDIDSQWGAETNKSPNKTALEICSLPSFNDIHIVGAVIAHTVDAVFQTALAARPQSMTPAIYKAGLAMQWLKNLESSNEVLELSHKQTLSRVLNSALGTALTALRDHDLKDFCSVVHRKFPAVLNRWKEKPAEDLATILRTCEAKT